MNAFYESFLRKDIFPNEPEKIDIIMEVYETRYQDKLYIQRVLDDYVNGASELLTYKRLYHNIIAPYRYAHKKFVYLEDEYKDKLY